jgi:hypothetical protein
MYVRKTISNLLSMLEVLIWENINSKYYFVFIQTYASYLAKGYLQNDLYKRRYVLPTRCLKMNFKILLYKVLSLILGSYFKTLILGLPYASKALFTNY